MGKQKKKKRKGVSSRKGGGQAGPSEEPLEGVVNEGIVNLELNHVEFIYSEMPLKYHRQVDPATFIPATFIEDSLRACVVKWNTYLPGVCVEDLHAQVFPEIPLKSTFEEWGGVVHVELKQGRLTPVCKQVENLHEAKAALRRKEAECELLVADAVEVAFSKMQLETSKAKKDEQRRIKELEETFKIFTNRQQMDKEDMNRAETRHEGEIAELKFEVNGHIHRVSQLEIEVSTHTKELKNLRAFSNQIKRREALQRARIKINNYLEKRKHETGETWSHYYKEFSKDDWAKIFTGGGQGLGFEHKVKSLLMYGSIQANHLIHDVEPEDVLEGIMAEDVASDREAWVWVHNCPFTKSLA